MPLKLPQPLQHSLTHKQKSSTLTIINKNTTNKETVKRTAEFSLFYQNIQCITNKIEELTIFLHNRNFGILAFTEHWLRPNQEIFIRFPGYLMASCFTRSESIHGGSCILVKNNIKYKELDYLKQKSKEFVIECAAVEIIQYKIIIINVYRSPVANVSEFIDTLEDMLLMVANKMNTHIVVLSGDFNVNFQKGTEQDVVKLVDMLRTFNLHPNIFEPTRVFGETATLIDNIFTNSHKLTSRINKSGLSDHYGLESFLETKSLHHKNEIHERRLISNRSIEEIKNKINLTDWNPIFRNPDPSVCTSSFVAIIKDTINDICPKKKILKKPNGNVQWITRDIKMKSRIKRQLYEKVRNGHCPKEIYKEYCKQLKELIRTTKIEMNSQYIENSSNKVKTTWNLVRHITGKLNASKLDISDVAEAQGKTVAEILNNINDFFINQCEDIIPKHGAQLADIGYNPLTMVLFDTDPTEVYNIIHSLNNTLATGYDEIPTTVLKKCADAISAPISELINLCFKRESFPDVLKYTVIKPVHKKGNKEDISNYRPIALVSTIDKIFEKVILFRMINFIKRCKIFTTCQNAYIQGRSTTRAIYMAVCEILDALNGGEKIAAIFVDLSKAFDSVDHQLLIKKLECMGFRGRILNIVQSYLYDRKQCVLSECEGRQITSEWKTVKRGVPQGTILGPLLFLLYINDVPHAFSHALGLYADDTSIIIRSSSNEELKKEISKCLDKSEEWFTLNNLKLNVNKTQLLQFSFKKQASLEVCHGNEKLTSNFNTRFLGVILDSQLAWKPHIWDLASKLSSFVYALRTIANSVNCHTALTAYYAYIHSKIRYGIIFWGNSVEAPRIFKIQKSCLRAIFHMRKMDSCKKVFKEYGILTVPAIYIYESLCFVRDNYVEFLSKYEQDHSYNTRGYSNLRIPSATTATFHRNVEVQLIRMFNKLPNFYRNLSRPAFRRTLRSHLQDIVLYDIKELYF